MKFQLYIIICVLFFVGIRDTKSQDLHDYAIMMVEAYKNNNHNAPAGWSAILTASNPNGYYAVAFQKGNNIVIAHRGSDDLPYSDFDDSILNIGTGNPPEQFQNAIDFTNTIINIYPNTSITHTGQSLGAVLSELCVARFFPNQSATTFDSPGSVEIIENLIDDGEITIPSGQTESTFIALLYNYNKTYLAGVNIVNTANHHIGEIFRIYPPYSYLGILDSYLLSYLVYTKQQHSKELLKDQINPSTNAPYVVQEKDSWPEGYINGHINYFINYDHNTHFWNEYLRFTILNPVLTNLAVASSFQEGVTIEGDNTNNYIWGGTNDSDEIFAKQGNDIVVGYEGNDELNGGTGIDKVDYGWISEEIQNPFFLNVYFTGVVLNLQNETCNKGPLGTDIVKNFENAIGSDFSDILKGNNADNELSGGKGDDFLDGYGGNNELDGGEGDDTYLLSTSRSNTSIIFDNDGILIIDGISVAGNALGICDPIQLVLGQSTFLLTRQGEDLIVTREGYPNSKFIIKNYQNGTFGITIGSEEPQASIQGRQQRSICEGDPVSNTLSANIENCDNCDYEFSWNVNGITSTGDTYVLSSPGIYNVMLTATVGTCGFTDEGIYEINTYCCRDCDGDDDEGGSGGEGGNGGANGNGAGCVTTPTSICIPIIRAVDPNEIIGPTGYEDEKWVAASETLPYTVLFENDPDFATAPAQLVEIRVPLDSSLNPFDLRIGEFGFGDFIFEVPENVSAYQGRLDVVDSLGVFVDIIAGLDIVTQEAFWIFQSIDPATNLPSTLPASVGFLPVNDTLTRVGEGYVNFSIKPKSSTVSGDSILAQASITFDINAPIETNIARNKIDAFEPVSIMDTLPQTTSTDSIWLSWTGQDDSLGVGISYYDLYASTNDSAYTLIASNVDTTAYQFFGNLGSNYCFFVSAVDHVGNKESLKLSCEASITMGSLDTLNILHPNLTTIVCEEELLSIEWEASSSIQILDISLSPDGGNTEYLIADNIPSNSTPFLYALPDSILPGNSYLIRITDTITNGLSTSSGLFTISKKDTTYQTLLTCNANEVGMVLDTFTNIFGCDSLLITSVVLDDVLPTMLCISDTIGIDANGLIELDPSNFDGGITDNCGIDTIYLDQTSFNCDADGTTQSLSLTAIDITGNSNTCSTSVTIIDDIAPTAICKANLTGKLSNSGRFKPKVNKVNNGSFDNCSIGSLTVSPFIFFCDDIGPQVVTLTVMDDSGNTSTCTTNVNIVDQRAPKIRCPLPITITADTLTCTAFIDHPPVLYFDNCGGQTLTQIAGISDEAEYPIGVTTNTYEVVDLQGLTNQCSFTVTVIDPGNCTPPSPPLISSNTNVNKIAAYPNPFSQTTTIEYFLEEKSQVEIGVFDLAGRLVHLLHNGAMEAGLNSFEWNPSESKISAGVYYVRVKKW